MVATVERLDERVMIPDLLTFGLLPAGIVIRTVTIAQACRRMGRDRQALLDALNAARPRPALRRLALPTLPSPHTAP
jgi:hypothetical protein